MRSRARDHSKNPKAPWPTIEASLVKAALRRLPPEQQSLVESRVSSALGDVTGVSSAVVERMRRALTRREVRLLLGLPALTLLHG